MSRLTVGRAVELAAEIRAGVHITATEDTHHGIIVSVDRYVVGGGRLIGAETVFPHAKRLTDEALAETIVRLTIELAQADPRGVPKAWIEKTRGIRVPPPRTLAAAPRRARRRF